MKKLIDRILTSICFTISLLVIISFMPTTKCYADVNIKAYYQDLLQQEISHTNIPKYAERNNSEETIDPITGSLTLKCTDIHLPGKDGLDLKIARIYNSSEDECEKDVDGWADEKGVSLWNSVNQYSYNETRYNLGAGWSFAFPSVQITPYEKYYHDGEGNTYKILNKIDNNLKGYCELEGYQGKDVKFEDRSGSYSFIDSNMTVSYFDSTGSLVRIQDRFGNQIRFSYVWKQVGYMTFYSISQIVDSVGRTITFSNVGDNIEVTVQAPGETDTIKTIYKRSYLTKKASNIINSNTNTYQYLALSSVEDNAGRCTYYEPYLNNGDWPTESFKAIRSSEASMGRYLIGAVIYPGS